MYYLANTMLKKMPENMDRVMKFYHDYYKPNNCRLVVVGDFDTEQVKEIINTMIAEFKQAQIEIGQLQF